MFQRRFGYIWVEESENLLNGKKYPVIYMTGYFSVGFLLLRELLAENSNENVPCSTNESQDDVFSIHTIPPFGWQG